MAVDVATLHIQVKADGVPQATHQLEILVKQGEKAEQSTKKLSSSFDNLTKYMKAAAAALGAYKLAEWAKDAALLSARYDTLGAAMNVVGNNAGYTSKQMADYQAKLQSTGIAMVEARESLTKMASAHIDLAKSSELARVAQDAAVVAGTNSSEAFARMTQGIQSGEVEILKTLGLNVNFQASYEALSQTLGKTTEQLTENEKVTARTNAVLQKGTDIAGAYEAAMGTAGKQISSMQRYMDNLKVTVGGVFSDALLVAVESFSGGLKEANSEAEKLQQSEMKQWGQDLATVLSYVIDGFRGLYAIAATVFDTMKTGFSQVYDLGTAAAKMIRLDITGALESVREAMTEGEEYSGRLQKRFADTVDNSAVIKNQQIVAARLANEKQEAAKKEQLEQQRINSAMERTQREFRESEKKFEAEHSEGLLKIQQQGNDAALALQDASDQIALDNLAANHEQGLISISDYLDQKYEIEKAAIERSMAASQEELDAQLAILEQLKNNPYADKTALAKKEAQYSTAKTQYQLQAISLSRLENETLNERVRLLGVEAEHAKNANLVQEQFSIRQQEINALKESGETEELFNQQKNLDLDKLRFEYAEKMLDYQKQLNTATQAEAGIIKQNISLYQQMFNAAESAIEARTQAAATAAAAAGANSGSGIDTTNWSGMNGMTYTVQTGGSFWDGSIARMEEERQQAEQAAAQSIQDAAADAAAAAQEAAEAAEEAQRKWEEYNTAFTNLNNDLAVRALDLEGREYEAELLKLEIAQQKELTDAQEAGLDTTNLLIVQQAEYNDLLKQQELDKHAALLAKVTQNTQTFFDMLKTTISELTSSGNTLVASLRNAAINLRQTAVDMSIGEQSNLSPEKQYEISRQNLASTVQRAMATGDADLYATIPTLVSSFLETSRSYNASNSQYSSDFAWAKDLLNASAAGADYAASNAQNVITAMEKQQATLDAIKAALRDDNTAALPKLLKEMESDTGTLNRAVSATNKALSDTGAIATRFTTSFAADSPLVKANGNIAVSIDKTSGVLTYTRQSIDGINVTLGVAGDTISAPFIAQGAVPVALRGIGTTNANAITTSGATVSSGLATNGATVSNALSTNGTQVSGAVTTNGTTVSTALGGVKTAVGAIPGSLSGVGTTVSGSVAGIPGAITDAGSTVAAPFIAQGAVPVALRSIGTTNSAAITESGTRVSGAVSANGTTVSAAIGGNTTAMTGVGTSVNASAAKVSGAVTTNGSAVSTSLASTGTAVSTALSANGATVSGGVKASGATISTGLAGNGKAVSDSLAASGSAISGSVAANGSAISTAIGTNGTTVSAPFGASGSFTSVLSGVGSSVSGSVSGIPGAISTAGASAAGSINTAALANTTSISTAVGKVGTTAAGTTAAVGTVNASVGAGNNSLAATVTGLGGVKTSIGTTNESFADAIARLVNINSGVGGVKTSLGTVNTSVGGVTTGVTAGTNSLAAWLKNVNTSTATVSTAVTGVRTAVAPLVDIRTNTSTTATRVNPLATINTNTSTTATRVNPLATINTNTAGTVSRLTTAVGRLSSTVSNLSSINSKTGKIKSTSTTIYPALNSEQTIYTYYAKGGIADKPSIFGEAGPEAAVPLPDGRSIPVTITQPADNYRLDMSELVAEVRELRKENEELKRAIVGKLTDIESPLRRVAAR
jgi:hypothetical protein